MPRRHFGSVRRLPSDRFQASFWTEGQWFSPSTPFSPTPTRGSPASSGRRPVRPWVPAKQIGVAKTGRGPDSP